VQPKFTALDDYGDIPSGSDISGASDDSLDDETYRPRDEMISSEEEEEAGQKMGDFIQLVHMVPQCYVDRERYLEDLAGPVLATQEHHLPEVAAKVPRCCRIPGCKTRSTVWYTKCKDYLCMKQSNNCFLKYHTGE